MKTKMTMTLVAALGAFVLAVNAQDAGSPPPGGDQGGPGKNGRRPTPAIIKALDANHDGVIDADEIANASAALKTLDKNGDGKLTVDEFMGPRPQGKGKPPGEGGPENSNNNGPQGPPPGN